MLPGLLIFSLNRFAIDATGSGDWIARTFDGKRAAHSSVKEWIFGSEGLLEMLTIGTWDKLLRYSTPFFQLAEGFCSLLVIQAAGQITRWLVNRERSDSWMVCSFFYSNNHTLIETLDRAPRLIGVYHLQLGLLPLENHDISRNWERRCNFDRRYHDVRGFPLRLGNWKWTRKPG